MKRFFAKLFVFLLLGAVVNVAVAWGCLALPSQWRTITYDTYQLDKDGFLIWEVAVETSPGTERVKSGRIIRNGLRLLPGGELPAQDQPRLPSWTRLSTAPPEENDRLDASGWPLLSLLARYGIEKRARAFRSSPQLGGWATAFPSTARYPFLTDRVTIPLTPIWPGFAINTAFYAAIVWMLFAAPGMVRRWRRIRRELCVKCAYPVGTSDVCTECGAKLKFNEPRP